MYITKYYTKYLLICRNRANTHSLVLPSRGQYRALYVRHREGCAACLRSPWAVVWRCREVALYSSVGALLCCGRSRGLGARGKQILCQIAASRAKRKARERRVKNERHPTSKHCLLTTYINAVLARVVFLCTVFCVLDKHGGDVRLGGCQRGIDSYRFSSRSGCSFLPACAHRRLGLRVWNVSTP